MGPQYRINRTRDDGVGFFFNLFVNDTIEQENRFFTKMICPSLKLAVMFCNSLKTIKNKSYYIIYQLDD